MKRHRRRTRVSILNLLFLFLLFQAHNCLFCSFVIIFLAWVRSFHSIFAVLDIKLDLFLAERVPFILRGSAQCPLFAARKGTMPQTYAPVQNSIPEEDPAFSSDDDSNFRLHHIDRPASGSDSPRENEHGEPSILAPLVRKSADFETYLDSLTEDEQQLLTASKEYELDDLDVHGNGKAAARRRLSEAKKKRKQLVKPGGWRAVYYSKTWWRTLVVVIIALGLLVWGFLTYAASSGDE